MPVRVWSSEDGQLSSSVVTEWDSIVTDEEYRSEAEQLDSELDDVLDAALDRVASEVERRPDIRSEFIGAWAVGRALADSNVYAAPALLDEPRQLLWRALAAKIRVGVRSDGRPDGDWSVLRPVRTAAPLREGGKRGKPDHFEMCRWLAEMELEDAAELFGGSIRNVWQMFERAALRSMKLRFAVLSWLLAQPDAKRGHLTTRRIFPEMMKALRQRWPARGPGSAKRPEHYDEDALAREVCRQLRPFEE